MSLWDHSWALKDPSLELNRWSRDSCQLSLKHWEKEFSLFPSTRRSLPCQIQKRLRLLLEMGDSHSGPVNLGESPTHLSDIIVGIYLYCTFVPNGGPKFDDSGGGGGVQLTFTESVKSLAGSSVITGNANECSCKKGVLLAQPRLKDGPLLKYG